MTSTRTGLCALILIVYGLIAITDAQDVVTCQNLYYSGPIKEVIEMKPTKLAEGTNEAAEIAKGFALDMASGAIGSIPYVGSALSSLFDNVADAFGDASLSAEDVYNSLSQEISKLKQYMDQEIEELKFDQIKKAFGTDRGGMLSYAKHCKDTYKSDPDDMVNCLENLRSMLIQQYHFFVPEPADTRASSYEQTLPLFRMYGQLFVDTLLDQIHVAKKRGKDDEAVAHAKALIKRVGEFESHTKEAVEKILKLHVAAHIMPPKNNPKCSAPMPSGHTFCTCTIALGPSKFDNIAVVKDKFTTKNFCIGVIYDSYRSCEETIAGYQKKYMEDHATAVVTYWKKQLGVVVVAWKETAENLKPMVENHKRSLSLLERIQFERDVAAEIAKEKQMMQK
ncbi:hypothetical protein ACROYT_G018127 [Oculina patagonica]